MARSFVPQLLIVAVSALMTVGQVLLKIGMKGQPVEISLRSFLPLVWRVVTTSTLLGGWLCGTVATILWLAVLSRLQLGYASPVVTAIYFVLLTIASRYLLDEPFTPARLGGIALLVIGILVLGTDAGSPPAPGGGTPG